MANHKLAEVAAVRGREKLTHPVHVEGLRIDEKAWNSSFNFIYVGDRQAVLGAGLARPEWLPGAPECANSTTFTIMVGDRRFRIVRRNKLEFAVEVSKTDEERAAGKRQKNIEAALPGMKCESIPPDVATRLLACWGLLARAALDIGVRCEGSTKLQRALDDVLQVRDVLGGIAGALADIRIPEDAGRRLRNDQELRSLVLQIEAVRPRRMGLGALAHANEVEGAAWHGTAAHLRDGRQRERSQARRR